MVALSFSVISQRYVLSQVYKLKCRKINAGPFRTYLGSPPTRPNLLISLVTFQYSAIVLVSLVHAHRLFSINNPLGMRTDWNYDVGPTAVFVRRDVL